MVSQRTFESLESSFSNHRDGHRSRSVRNFCLNAAIVFEPEATGVVEIVKDSAERFLYLQVGEHEKMFDEGAIYQSKIVREFTRQLEERVTIILEDAKSAGWLSDHTR